MDMEQWHNEVGTILRGQFVCIDNILHRPRQVPMRQGYSYN
jgi:hypothetical protein